MDENNNNALEGMESQIDADAFQGPALHEQQTADEQLKWQRELEASRKERKESNSIAVKAFKRYRDDRSTEHASSAMYNIFFANTDLKLAALYANLPNPDISRRNADPDDQVSRVAANILQRVETYELDAGNFDGEIRNVLKDYVLAGMGVAWLRYEEEMQAQPPIVPPVAPHPLTGEPYQPAPIPQPDIATHQMSCIDYVAWDDFYWAPSKVWTLCPWVARRVPMTKQAIEKRFGHTCPADVLRELTYSNKENDQSDDAHALHPKNQVEETTDVYEFWDKERKLIVWFVEGAEIPLDVQNDVCGFDGFFPTPMPPLGRFDTANTQPISDYKETRGKYTELDSLNMRCVDLEKDLKLRGAYDGAFPELKDLLTNVGENRMVPVANWAQLMSDKGGLNGCMQFVDLAPIAQAYQIASAQKASVKAEIYEVEGITDIQRGLATPYETATATTAKMASSFGRFAIKQADVAKYIAGLLRLKAHMVCKFYEPQIILQRIGVMNPADQQYIQPALEMLKGLTMTDLRLNVSVDSLQLPTWNNEKPERTALLQAVTGFMTQVLPGVQQVPQLAPIAMGMLKFAVAGFKGAQDVEGLIDQGIDQLMQAQAQAQQSNAQQPPKPTPEELKMQQSQQDNQTQIQLAQMKAESDQALQQQQLQFKAWQTQLEQQSKAQQQQIDLLQQKLAAGRLQHDIQDDAAQHAHGVAMDMILAGKPSGGK